MVGNQSPLPLIDLSLLHTSDRRSWESVTSPFDRLNVPVGNFPVGLGISHLSL